MLKPNSEEKFYRFIIILGIALVLCIAYLISAVWALFFMECQKLADIRGWMILWELFMLIIACIVLINSWFESSKDTRMWAPILVAIALIIPVTMVLGKSWLTHWIGCF